MLCVVFLFTLKFGSMSLQRLTLKRASRSLAKTGFCFVSFGVPFPSSFSPSFFKDPWRVFLGPGAPFGTHLGGFLSLLGDF